MEPRKFRTALNKILTKELNLRKASVRYNIPKSTLHDKASALKRGEEVTLIDCEVIFDRHLFSDLDYLAADMTNIPLEEPGTSSKTTNYSSKDSVSVADLAIAESTAATCKLASREFPKFPHCSINETIFSSPQSSTSLDPDITQALHKLSPLPDAAKKRSAARKRKCERSEILTSSPYKIAVIEKENEKNSKEKKKKVKINLKSAMEKEGEQRKDAKAKGKRGKQAQGEKSKNKDERDHQLNHLKKKELLA